MHDSIADGNRPLLMSNLVLWIVWNVHRQSCKTYENCHLVKKPDLSLKDKSRAFLSGGASTIVTLSSIAYARLDALCNVYCVVLRNHKVTFQLATQNRSCQAATGSTSKTKWNNKVLSAFLGWGSANHDRFFPGVWVTSAFVRVETSEYCVLTPLPRWMPFVTSSVKHLGMVWGRRDLGTVKVEHCWIWMMWST